MIGRPSSDEAASYYFKYIDQVTGDDVVGALTTQLEESLGFLQGISDEKSLHRYAPDKWSIRQVINHVSDTERVFAFRALWFGRGFDSPLPSFDEKVSSAAARADEVSWASHLEELRGVRLATLSLFRHLPDESWTRSGVASGNSVSVRALAYIMGGHLAHHLAIVRERYL
jgi:uncharacterized damage-inducible protein DinB